MFKVFGAREADLAVKAKKTRLYVCRVNDYFDNVVFSDWVKLKVLDIDKTGTRCSLFARIRTAWRLRCGAVTWSLSCSLFLWCLNLSNVVRIASRLAGWTTHRYQPRTANSPARCWYHSPMCCLWHSHSTLPVVQERAGTARWDRRHTTGKQRLLTCLSADSECLHSHWWTDIFNSMTLSNASLSAMVFTK